MARHAASASHPRLLYAALPLVACATAVAVYFLAPGGSAEHTVANAAPAVAETPTAREFARRLIGVTNAYAAASGDAARIANANCVRASRVEYMCSYASKRPGGRAECHIMQGRWTPNAASTITVTLAGRANRCGTLREALRSLA
jgi:hypothetical protein